MDGFSIILKNLIHARNSVCDLSYINTNHRVFDYGYYHNTKPHLANNSDELNIYGLYVAFQARTKLCDLGIITC